MRTWSRPITTTGGKIDQLYLYGEQSGTSLHRGVDFPYNTGTAVYAAHAGRIVALRENLPDNTHPNGTQQFGNYVMMRHGQQIYDTVNNSVGYAYTIYAHLKYNSVVHSTNTDVSASTQIASSNNTGNSTGAHLHFQVVTSNVSTETDPEDWTWSESESRNPEIWLSPYGNSTGTIAGRLSDNGGSPINNKTIRPTNALKSSGNTDGTFEWMTTYNYSWTRPDEIFGENFATTDVNPGTFCFNAKNSDGTQFRDLGCTTVVAGQTAYLGLYPLGFPDANGSNTGTISTISLQNLSTARSANVLTNFIQANGNNAGSRQNHVLSTRSSVNFNATSSLDGATITVGSEEMAGIIQNSRNTTTKRKGAYAGITAAQASNFWYVPLVMNQVSSLNGQVDSFINVMNMDNSTATITIYLIGDKGAWNNSNANTSFSLAPYASTSFAVSYIGISGWYGSATVAGNGIGLNGAKIAVTTDLRQTDSVQTFNAFAEGSKEWAIPLFTSHLSANNLTTPVGVQNLGSQINTGRLQLSCKVGSGSSGTDFTKTNTSAIPTNGAYYFNPAPDDSGYQTNWYGSCRVKALDNQNVVTFVQMRVPPPAVSGSGFTTNMAAAYEGMPTDGGKLRVSFPYIQKVKFSGSTTYLGGLATGVTIQNLSTTSTANVTFTYYNADGSVRVTKNCTVAADKQLIHNHRLISEGTCAPDLPSEWVGSLVVTSDQPIDGFNQITDTSNPSGDHFMAHNGLP